LFNRWNGALRLKWGLNLLVAEHALAAWGLTVGLIHYRMTISPIAPCIQGAGASICPLQKRGGKWA